LNRVICSTTRQITEQSSSGIDSVDIAQAIPSLHTTNGMVIHLTNKTNARDRAEQPDIFIQLS
jgi:hypothetical protein